MKKLLASLFVGCVLFGAPACYTLNHTVGGGPTQGVVQEKRAWWVLWGLVPINEFDTEEMAGNATSYRVTSEFAPVDILINFFTSVVSITTQTVRVEK